jgi:hypothetical protein
MDIFGVPGTVFFVCGLIWIPVMFALLGDNPVAGVIAAILSYLTGRAFVIGSDFVQGFHFGLYEKMVFILMGIALLVAFIAVYRCNIAGWIRGPEWVDDGWERSQAPIFPQAQAQPEIFPQPFPMEQDQQGRPVPLNPGRRR